MNTVPATCILDGSSPEPCNLNGLPGWRCPTCALMWRQSFDMSLAHYEDAEGNYSNLKEKLQRRNIRDRIRTLAKHIDCNGTCDIGCSKGYFVEELLTAGYKDACGIDPNKTQIEIARTHGLPLYEGSAATAAALFKEHHTKNATLFHVIEHLPDPVAIIQELRAALPEGGHVVVETPNFTAYAFKKLGYQHKLVYPEHLFYFSFENLQTLLTQQGFSIVYAGKRDFDPHHLPIREIFFRLGLTDVRKPPSVMERIMLKLCRPLSPLLSELVPLVGRGSFSFIIARKEPALP